VSIVNATPTAPKRLAASGRRLWQSVVGEYDLDVHEELVLLQACRCADRLDRLDEAAASSSVTVVNHRGDQVPHPALTESRQQSIVLARLIAALRMPTGDVEDLSRPQRRGAPRGVYGVVSRQAARAAQ
jgi:hypothetical protein